MAKTLLVSMIQRKVRKECYESTIF